MRLRNRHPHRRLEAEISAPLRMEVASPRRRRIRSSATQMPSVAAATQRVSVVAARLLLVEVAVPLVMAAAVVTPLLVAAAVMRKVVGGVDAAGVAGAGDAAEVEGPDVRGGGEIRILRETDEECGYMLINLISL